jgi:hypothetical protein
MDFDLNTATQSVTGVIPAILPVAETTGTTPSEMLAAFIVARDRRPAFSCCPPGLAKHQLAWHRHDWHHRGGNRQCSPDEASSRENS